MTVNYRVGFSLLELVLVLEVGTAIALVKFQGTKSNRMQYGWISNETDGGGC